MERIFHLMSSEDFSQFFDILLLTGIEILRAEIDFRVDPILDRKIDSLKEHGVRNIHMDERHVEWVSSMKGWLETGYSFYIILSEKTQTVFN